VEALHHQRLVPAPGRAFQKQAGSVTQFKTVDLGPIARLPTGMNALDCVREKGMEMLLYVCNKLAHGCIIEGSQGLVKCEWPTIIL